MSKETDQKQFAYNNNCQYDINFSLLNYNDNTSDNISVYAHTDFYFILFDLSLLSNFKEARRIYK